MRLKIGLLTLLLSVLLVCPAMALDIDTDDNTAVDITFGGTNAATASDARDNLGLTIGSDVQAHDDNLDDVAGLTPEKGAVIYWDTATTMARLRFNASDVEGYILQATGAYPNTVPALTNTLNITKLIFPNAADPTTDTEAQCSWDTDDRALECYDDASQLGFTLRKMNAAVVADPDNLPVSIITIMDVDAAKFPHGVIVKSCWLECDSTPTADYVVVVEEWTGGNDGTGKSHSTDCATLTLTAATDYENATTTIDANCSGSTSGVDADDLLRADFDDTDWAAEDFDECIIGCTYEIEDGN